MRSISRPPGRAQAHADFAADHAVHAVAAHAQCTLLVHAFGDAFQRLRLADADGLAQQQVAPRIGRHQGRKPFAFEALQGAHQRLGHPGQRGRCTGLGVDFLQAGITMCQAFGGLRAWMFRPTPDHAHAAVTHGHGLDQDATQLAALAGAFHQPQVVGPLQADARLVLALQRQRQRVQRIGQGQAHGQRQARPLRRRQRQRKRKRQRRAGTADPAPPQAAAAARLLLGHQQAGRDVASAPAMRRDLAARQRRPVHRAA
jgi:hypothetical protein